MDYLYELLTQTLKHSSISINVNPKFESSVSQSSSNEASRTNINDKENTKDKENANGKKNINDKQQPGQSSKLNEINREDLADFIKNLEGLMKFFKKILLNTNNQNSDLIKLAQIVEMIIAFVKIN